MAYRNNEVVLFGLDIKEHPTLEDFIDAVFEKQEEKIREILVDHSKNKDKIALKEAIYNIFRGEMTVFVQSTVDTYIPDIIVEKGKRYCNPVKLLLDNRCITLFESECEGNLNEFYLNPTVSGTFKQHLVSIAKSI